MSVAVAADVQDKVAQSVAVAADVQDKALHVRGKELKAQVVVETAAASGVTARALAQALRTVAVAPVRDVSVAVLLVVQLQATVHLAAVAVAAVLQVLLGVKVRSLLSLGRQLVAQSVNSSKR